MRVISIFNQKGGVGKTTSVVNLAVSLSQLGKKILVIDIDPQANTTTGLGLEKHNIENSLYDLFYDKENLDAIEKEEISKEKSENDNIDLGTKEEKLENGDENNYLDEKSPKEEIDVAKYIIKTDSTVDIIASESSLSGLEVELVPLDPIERTQKLKELIKLIDHDNYDFVLIDCPPSLGLLSVNALVASDSIIIPIQTEYYALEGVSELMKTYNLVKQSLNPKLEIEGVLLSMFDINASLSYEVAEEVKSYFKTLVFKFMIPRNPRLAEAPSHGLSTIEYDRNSKGAIAYINLSKEIIKLDEERNANVI